MTFDADSLAERRRLKRRVSHWRIAAILAFALVVLILGARNGNLLTNAFPQQQIARITIEGFISDNREQRKLLKQIADAKQVKGVIVFINSPGGTTAGAEGLYLALRKLSEKKPTVAVFGTVATSAAYLAGISTDHIVARGNSITGSVGVIVQWAEVSNLLKNLGVHFEEVRSGSLKAVPSPFTATDSEGRKLVEQLVNESRDWFVQLVKDRRKLNNDVLNEVRTGRIYTGRQALPIGLIDEIGDEDTARTWLEEKQNVPKDLAVVDWKTEESTGWFSLRGTANGAGDFLGTVFYRAGQKLTNSYQFNNLDGLNSVWHPQQQQ
jgi:protease IV